MKESPIIMSGNHPLKCLDGTKTQTRRVIVPQPAPCRHKEIFSEKVSGHNAPSDWQGQVIDWIGYKYEGREGWFCQICGNGLRLIDEWSGHGIICPFGGVGDRLWVRETHYHYGSWKPTGGITKTGKIEWEFVPSDYRRVNYFDNPPKDYLTRPSYLKGWYKRPSLFMPRWASRILLEITEIRVERVQEITEEDAMAEGCRNTVLSDMYPDFNIALKPASHNFRELWDSLNAKRGYGWNVSPFVWCISFRRI